MRRLVVLWGEGGYYWLLADEDGNRLVPAGRAAWARFVQYAPASEMALAFAALKYTQAP
jgi:hypothetical protein